MPTRNRTSQDARPTAPTVAEQAATQRALRRENAADFYGRLREENATSRANELLRQRTWAK